MTRLVLLLTLLASSVFGQTYVRPSKGVPFFPYSTLPQCPTPTPFPGCQPITVSPGILRYGPYSPGYDWSAFDAARIRIYSESPGNNTAGAPCASQVYQFTVTNFGAYIRFVVVRTGLGTPQVAVSVQDAPAPSGPWSFASPTTNYRSEFGGCDIKVQVTPIAFAPNILQGIDVATGIPYNVSVDATTGALLTTGSGGGTTTDAGITVAVPTCTTTQTKITSVGTTAAFVPSVLQALPGRWMVRVCNSPRNAGTPIITCATATSGVTPDAGLLGIGESLEVGDCATYTTSDGVSCISDTAATAVSSWECQ